MRIEEINSDDSNYAFNSVSIIFPCLNEEESIGYCINEIKDIFSGHNKQIEIIVVDNGSIDNSENIAKECGAIVLNENKKGYGSALRRGFAKAKGEIIVMLDADGTYDPSKLPYMIDLIKNNNVDFVIGDRFNGKIEKGAMPWLHRRIGNPFLTFVLNRIYGMEISDAHCGLRVFRKTILTLLNLETSGMEFASEMLVKLSQINNISITQVPITFRKRKGGNPHLRSFRDGWRHLFFLVKNRSLKNRPIESSYE